MTTEEAVEQILSIIEGLEDCENYEGLLISQTLNSLMGALHSNSILRADLRETLNSYNLRCLNYYGVPVQTEQLTHD